VVKASTISAWFAIKTWFDKQLGILICDVLKTQNTIELFQINHLGFLIPQTMFSRWIVLVLLAF